MKKKYIIFIALLIIYFLILFAFIGINNITIKPKEATIIIDTETLWKLNNGNWINMDSKIYDNELSDKLFTVFIDNKNIGTFFLEKENNWLLYDTNRNLVKYEGGSFFAVNSNYQINVKKITVKETSDFKYINQVLYDNNITDTSEFTVNLHYEIDFDDDGKTENFYTISNAFARETSPPKVFSIAFMEKEDKIYYLYKSIEENDGQNGCKPYINMVMDLDNDKKHEIILSCGYYSIQNRYDMMYSFKDNAFKLLVDNK